MQYYGWILLELMLNQTPKNFSKEKALAWLETQKTNDPKQEKFKEIIVSCLDEVMKFLFKKIEFSSFLIFVHFST